MDDMVYNALRRKLAVAQEIGDLERIERLRRMMGVSAEVSSEDHPEDVAEIVEQQTEQVMDDPPDVIDLDESIVDADDKTWL